MSEPSSCNKLDPSPAALLKEAKPRFNVQPPVVPMLYINTRHIATCCIDIVGFCAIFSCCCLENKR